MRIFLFVTFLACISWAQPKPEITLHPTTEVSQRAITRLGDVASVEGASEELLAILDGINLPSKDKITSEEMSALIKAELETNENFKHANASFKIPSEIQLHKSNTPISKIEVERRVTNILKARCSSCVYKINIQSAPFPTGTDWELDYSQLSAKGSFLLPVKDSDLRAAKWVSGSVRVTKLTPVANRFVQVGERLQPDDLKMALVDVTFAKESDARIEDLQGQQVLKSLQIGQAVWPSDIKREPAAKKGQMVKAILGDIDFEITTNLEAQDSGFIGDTIKVKNLENQKILSAVVTEKGAVKIQ